MYQLRLIHISQYGISAMHACAWVSHYAHGWVGKF